MFKKEITKAVNQRGFKDNENIREYRGCDDPLDYYIQNIDKYVLFNRDKLSKSGGDSGLYRALSRKSRGFPKHVGLDIAFHLRDWILFF